MLSETEAKEIATAWRKLVIEFIAVTRLEKLLNLLGLKLKPEYKKPTP